MVACAYILRGTWRANSETGVSGHTLISVDPIRRMEVFLLL